MQRPEFLRIGPGLAIILVLAGASTRAEDAVRVLGPREVWSPLTLEIRGPEAREDGTPNPFLDYRLVATFTQGDRRRDVPGYFAADGRAAETGATAGNLWRVHFVPDRPGQWRYRIFLRGGAGIALSDDRQAGDPGPGDGLTGTIVIAEAPGARGQLRHDGGHYLRFTGSGEAFLKAGADSPENFLAYADFDGTVADGADGPRARAGEARRAGLHTYAPHVRDWKPGDPTWRDGRGKGIIGALNYLASRGVNSVYFLTMNLRGDGRDVWPYPDPEQLDRFDCSKLDQWEIVFSHMDRLGMMLHVVLTETENENLFEYEAGCCDFADTRKLYYRELIARFGHHSALVWNLGEENGGNDGPKDNPNPYGLANTDAQRKAFSDYIRRLDPYDHPIVVHTFPGQYEKVYGPLLGHPSFDGPSLQMGNMRQTHAETIRWADASAAAGRPWFVNLDEIGPADTGVKPDADDPDHDDVRHHALWGNLMGGGAGVEWYFGYKYPHNDLNAEDFRSRERMWDQTRHAVTFFRKYLPFTEMRHADDMLSNREAYCFARAGAVYAVYLPPGRHSTELKLPGGTYSVSWFNPRDGGDLQAGSISTLEGGGFRALGEPPRDTERDWVALVIRKN